MSGLRLDELPGPVALTITVTIGVLGLIIGSFLNVVILRLPNDESIVFPGSHCPKCGRSLSWYENVPVLSWLFLGGKCRTCKSPISPRYAIIELLTGCLFLAALQSMQLTERLPLALAFVAFIIPLVFIDIDHWIIETDVALAGIVTGLLLQIPLGLHAVLSAVTGVVVAYVAFRVLELLGWLFTKREALGMGDKFLFALIAAYVGWKPLLGVLLLASMQGSVWGLLSIAFTGRAAPELKPDAKARGGSAGTAAPEAGTTAAPESAPVTAAPESGPVAATEPGASPSGDESAEEEDAPLPFTPEFTKPGLTAWQRLKAVPYTLFLQPIPDDPPLPEGAEEDEEPEWTPGATNMPFGPWLGLAGLEVLLLGPFLAAHLGNGLVAVSLRSFFLP